MKMDNENLDLGDRVTALETGLAALNTAIANLPAGITQDELNNATQSLADTLASLSATVAALPAGSPTVAAALDADAAYIVTWAGNVMHKFFSGEKPDAPAVSG